MTLPQLPNAVGGFWVLRVSECLEYAVETAYINLTFRGPCIVTYSCNKSQRDALYLKFIFYKNF